MDNDTYNEFNSVSTDLGRVYRHFMLLREATKKIGADDHTCAILAAGSAVAHACGDIDCTIEVQNDLLARALGEADGVADVGVSLENIAKALSAIETQLSEP